MIHVSRTTRRLVLLLVGASCVGAVGCTKPTAKDIPFDAKTECGDLVTIHHPRGFVITKPAAGMCAVEPSAESGFDKRAQLIVAVVEVSGLAALQRATVAFASAYAQKPGWTEKSVEQKPCFGDRESTEIAGTLTEGSSSLDMRICSFLVDGRVVQITRSLDASQKDADLIERLYQAVEIHGGAPPAPSAAASK